MNKGEAIHVILETVAGARIVCGDTWLCVTGETYTVYQRKHGQKKTCILFETDIEEEAVKYLDKE